MWFFSSFRKSLTKVIGYFGIIFGGIFALGAGLQSFPTVASSPHGKQILGFCANTLDFVFTCLFDKLVESIIFILAVSWVHWIASQRPVDDAKAQYKEARLSARPQQHQVGRSNKNRNRSIGK